MRILVAGATGYIGSRLVPELLRRGHEVVAAASSPPDPDRFCWSDRAELRQMDAADPDQVRAALTGVDALCYLVHGLSSPRFPSRDRLAATVVRDAVSDLGIGRVVYLSGLVPDVPPEQLSPHVASRLEVERLLLSSAAATLSMRAGVVVGAGSTSFEMVRQTASTLLVQPVPVWMRSRVQPIGVGDCVRVLADALAGDAVGDVDIAGPDVVTYPELLELYAELTGLPRLQVPVVGAPVTAVALGAGLVSAAPYWTAAALVRSLRHDMVARPGQPDPTKVDLTDALPLREAMAQAVLADGPGGRVAGREASDPAWVRSSWVERGITATRLPGSTLLSSALHVAEHRVRGLLGLVR
ncbi:MAG: NAD(P)H-binding protein [Nocardioidaceae bacterium]